MFTVSNAGENSGEAYKLSSDVGAYIFVLLKNPRAGFLSKGPASVPQINFYRFHSTLQLFSSA